MRPAGIQKRSKRQGVSTAVGGAILLEVLIALGLLVFGMAVVGVQINAGLLAARSNDLRTRTMLLVDTKMAEFDSRMLIPEREDDEMMGDFGIHYPGFMWRMTFEPVEIDNFIMITLEIAYNQRLAEQQREDPDLEIDIEEDPEGTKIIRKVYRLWPMPANVDLERDFGLSEDELNTIAEQVPIPGFDPTDIDLLAFTTLDDESLLEMLPVLEGLVQGEGSDLGSLMERFSGALGGDVDAETVGEALSEYRSNRRGRGDAGEQDLGSSRRDRRNRNRDEEDTETSER